MDIPDGASLDGTASDTSAGDVIADAPDSGLAGDTGPGDDGAITDGSSGDAGDGGAILKDGGPLDGSLCPPCLVNWTCCTVMQSVNYGKCYQKWCLACCM